MRLVGGRSHLSRLTPHHTQTNFTHLYLKCTSFTSTPSGHTSPTLYSTGTRPKGEGTGVRSYDLPQSNKKVTVISEMTVTLVSAVSPLIHVIADQENNPSHKGDARQP